MHKPRCIYRICVALLTWAVAACVQAQELKTLENKVPSLQKVQKEKQRAFETVETHVAELGDTVPSLMLRSDSLAVDKSKPKVFVPKPARSLWMALIFPGGGQIYNRKYWKLPIIYGGFVGCAYALSWNGKQYKDYSQAYLDIMDDDPNTKSYEDFLPRSSSIEGQEARYQEIFRKRKDLYRRQRDLSLFAMVGVYLLSVVDAYVDAELSDFDITDDLSMRIEPKIIHSSSHVPSKDALGLQCVLTF